MSIAEYQLSLKNLIDATNDETLLKRWKEQLEADIAEAKETNLSGTEASSSGETQEEPKKDDTSDYVVIESGLGIDE